MTSASKLSGVAILATILGAFLPWISFFGITKYGIEGDGAITLVIAVIGLVALLLFTKSKLGRRPYLIVSGVGAALVTVVAMTDMNGVAAIGLYVTLFAGIAWVTGLVWEARLGTGGGGIQIQEEGGK